MKPPLCRKARQEERRAVGPRGGRGGRPGTRYKEEAEAEAEAGAQSGRLTVPSPAGPGAAPSGSWHLRPGRWAGTRFSVPRWLRAPGEVTSWTGAARGRRCLLRASRPLEVPKVHKLRSAAATSSGWPGGLLEALLCISEMCSPKANMDHVT